MRETQGSISQAMENASAGDIISVGAGIYGNISGDGSFTHPGDEHPQLVVRPRRTGTDGCIICISNPLKVLSLHGASATIIVGTSSETYPATVFFTNNQASGSGIGFAFEDNAFTGSASFKNTVASGAGTGFVAVTGIQSESGAASGSGCSITTTSMVTIAIGRH